MFTLYCDASGSPDDTKVLTVAGFVSSNDQWLEFERNWKETLRDFGVSMLHMRDYAHSRGEFASWKNDKNKRRHFLSSLIGHIVIRTRHSFATAVLLHDWALVNSEFCLEDVIKPFTVCAGSIVHKTRRWQTAWNIPDGHVKCVFEDGDRDKGDFVRQMSREGNPAPIFMKKNEACAFQAADLLAYEHLLAHTRIFDGKITDFEQLRRSLRELYDVPSGKEGLDWTVFGRDGLEKFCIDVGVPRRDAA